MQANHLNRKHWDSNNEENKSTLAWNNHKTQMAFLIYKRPNPHKINIVMRAESSPKVLPIKIRRTYKRDALSTIK